MSQNNLKYPIGHYLPPKKITKEYFDKSVLEIAAFVSKLKQEVKHLTEEQLNTPYRPNGWTIRQVVHHCADSHMNSFTRFKLALTEDIPKIKPFFENRWAELADGKSMPIECSLMLLEGLNIRCVGLLKSLTEQQLAKAFIHPDQEQEITIIEHVAFYAWHCRHHLAHITELKKRNNWK